MTSITSQRRFVICLFAFTVTAFGHNTSEGDTISAIFTPPSGNWSAASNWDIFEVPLNNATTNYNAFINASNVTFDTTGTIENLNIAPQGYLSLGNGRTLTIRQSATSGTITNDGLIELNSNPAAFASLIYEASNDQDVFLNGSGTLRLNGYSSNRLVSTPKGAHLVSSLARIEGGGVILDFQLDNHGTIAANQPTKLLIQPAFPGITIGGEIRNHGTLRAESGGTLHLLNDVRSYAGSMIEALDDSAVIADIRLIGGTMRTIGTGSIEVSLGLSLDGSSAQGPVTLDCDVEVGGDTSLTVTGDIYNLRTISLFNNPGAPIIQGIFAENAAAFLRGGGTVSLNDSAENIVAGDGVLLTNVDNTIKGAGKICSNLGNMTNQGTIIANKPTPLVIDPLNTFTSPGTLRAEDGGTLVFRNGSFNFTDGIIEALDGSVVRFDGNVLPRSGTFQTSGTGAIRTGSFQTTFPSNAPPPTFNGLFQVMNGHQLTCSRGLVLNGELQLNSTGQMTRFRVTNTSVASDAPTITGTGRIVLGDNPGNIISASQLRTPPGLTIEGAGTIGEGTSFYNRGTIIANGVNPFIMNLDNTALSPNKYNDGIFHASGQGGFIFPMTYAFMNRNQVIVDAGSSISCGSYHQDDGLTSIAGNLSSGAPCFLHGGLINVTGTLTLVYNFRQEGGVLELMEGGVITVPPSFEAVIAFGTLTGGGLFQSHVRNWAFVAPGVGIGELTITRTYSQSATGTLVIEIDNTCDHLAIAQQATLNGRLQVQLTNNFDPPIGSTYQILTAGSITGTFAELDFPCMSNKQFAIAYSATAVTLTVDAAPLIAGDLNCDCDIDMDDISPFVLALVDSNDYEVQFPNCDINRADLNDDSLIDGSDVAEFVNLIID